MGTINGRIANIPENCIRRNNIVIKKKGFNVLFLVISLNLSNIVGGGCSHLMPDFSQFEQEAEISLICFNCSNSVDIASGETQPRRVCKDFCAFSERCFDKSQMGLSGTLKCCL